MAQVLPGGEIQDKIYLIRGVQVMSDRDLADLYEVETGALKRAVKRNIERFPGDFMFELTKAEHETLRCQIGISKVENVDNSLKTQETLRCQIGISKVENVDNSLRTQETLRFQIGTLKVDSLVENPETRGGDRFAPFVFTEPGVAMLSSVLRSDRAIQVNIAIMRTFIQLRRQKDFQTESLQKFRNLEDKLDEMHCRIEQLEDRSKNRSQASLVINRKDQIELANVPLNVAGANQGDKVIQIQHRVSKYFQLKVNDLKSDSRTRALVYARQIAIYLIRENLRLGFKEIGTHFCGRDHTTILHSYRKIHTKIKKDRSTEEAVFSIQKII